MLRKFKVTEGYYYGRLIQQRIDDEEELWLFEVNDLTECPEDAMINRDLFDADEYIEAVKFGIDLGRKGYTGIEVIKERIGE
jgi:hypothetical protein